MQLCAAGGARQCSAFVVGSGRWRGSDSQHVAAAGAIVPVRVNKADTEETYEVVMRTTLSQHAPKAKAPRAKRTRTWLDDARPD